MQDEKKTKEQLIKELEETRQRVSELEAGEIELKKVEEALRESETKYREIAASIPGVVYQFKRTQAGSISFPFVSEGISAILGVTPKEVMEKPQLPFGMMNPEQLGSVNQSIAESAREMKTWIKEFEVTSRTGESKWLRGCATPRLLADGSILWNGIMLDITERKKAEDILNQSKVITDNINEALILFDMDGATSFVNPTYEKLTGYKSSELLGKNGVEVAKKTVAKYDLERILEVFEKALKGEELPPILTYLKHKDGREIPIEFTASFVRDERGKIVRIVAVITDITERKLTEEELRESEEKLKALFDTSPDGIVITSLDGKILDANQAYQEMLGYTLDELKKLDFQQLTPEKWHETEAAAIKATMAGGHGVFEKEYIRKDGTIFPIALSGWILKDKQGNPIGIGAFIRDITERKLAEETLQESEEKFRTLAEQSPNMIFINKMGRVVYANEKCVELMGYTREEFYSPEFDFLVLIAPESQAFIKANFGRHKKGEVILPYEYDLLAKDGRRVHGLITTKLIEFEGGKAILGIITDISELKQKEDQLQKEITERKGTEEALRKSEEKFRTLAEQSLVGIYIFKEGKVVFANEATVMICGYSHEEVLGWGPREFSRIIHPEDRSFVLEQIQKKLAGAKDAIPSYDLRLISKSGEIKWVTVHSKAIPYEDSIALAEVLVDITERKQAEEEKAKYIHNLTFLSETAMDFVELSPDQDLYQFIGEKIKELVGEDAIVVLASYDELSDSLTSRSVLGVGKQMKMVLKLLGKDPIGRPIKAREDLESRLGAEGFVQLPSDLTELTQGQIPKRVSNALMKMLQLGEIYSMGFVQKGRLFGAVFILLRRGNELKNTKLIEAFVNQASVALLRKQALDELQESEEQYRNLVETMNDGLGVLDANDSFTYVNDKFCEMWGYAREEIVGHSIYDFLDGENLTILKEQMVKRKKGKHGLYELVWTGKGGRKVPTIVSSRPIYDAEGNYQGSVGVITDITQRKQAEEELTRYRDHLEELVKERASELRETNEQLQREIIERKLVEESLAAEKEQLAVALRSIGDGVITTDTKGKVVLINEIAEKLTGWSQEEAINKPLSAIFRIINEKTGEPCENPVEKLLETRKVVNLNHTILRDREETERVISVSAAPILNKDNQIIGVILVFSDITEKRIIEEELQKAQRLESIGGLAGGIAHDFNNILMAILGNVALAKIDLKSNVKVSERLSGIEKAVLRAKEMTQQLLTFSKGGAPIKKIISISDLLIDTAEFSLSGSNAECVFSLPDDLWPTEIDTGQMSQVFNNLILNAKESMPEGGIIRVKGTNIVVGAKQALPLPEGNYIKISIKDQGVGIPKKYLPKIFDPYFTTKQKGSGLGLAIVYSIIKKHDGHIKVKSKQGVGTTVHVYLPAAADKLLVKDEQPEKALKGTGKILVMDDEESILEAVSKLLERLGYNVVTAKEGNNALKLYKEAGETSEPFDVVIIDLTVRGGMGGKETVQKLLEIDPDAKAIVSSGYSDIPVMSDFRKHGFKGVLAKPYKLKELNSLLNQVINGP